MPTLAKDQSKSNRGNLHHSGSWLFIPYVAADAGDRPLPPGTVTWTSPVISVSPVDKFGKVQAGVPATVTTQIWNGGDSEAFAVYIELWWFNPTLAFTSAPDTQRIGSKLLNIAGNSYVEVDFPWTPGFVNNGHECLVVQCSSPTEGTDDLKYPFDAFRDRHVGQHNLMVSSPKDLPFIKLSVGNPFRSAGSFTLRVQTLLVDGKTDKPATGNIRDHIVRLANAVVGRTTTGADPKRIPLEVMDVSQHEFGIRVTGSRKIRSVLQQPIRTASQQKAEYSRYKKLPQGQDLDRYIHDRASGSPDFNPETLGRVLKEIVLEAGEVHEVEIEIPPMNVRSDRFLVHHFTQVIAGCDIGGYTVVVPPPGWEGK